MSGWTWDERIEATAFGCFIPASVIDTPEQIARVRAFFNWETRWPDFDAGELRSRGNGDLRISYATLDGLQKLRGLVKRPIVVTSYYRDPAYNAKIGGSQNSYHMSGRAVDTPLYATEIGRVTLVHFASLCGFRGFGLYDHFTHLDMGPHRVWDERTPVR